MVHVVQRHRPVLDDCCAKRTTAPDIPVTHRRRAVESALRDSGFASSSPGDRGQRPPPERPRKRDELEGVKATDLRRQGDGRRTVRDGLRHPRMFAAGRSGGLPEQGWQEAPEEMGLPRVAGPDGFARTGQDRDKRHRPKKGRGTEGLGPRGCKSSPAGSKVRQGTRMWSPRARVRSRQAGDSRSEVRPPKGSGRHGPARDQPVSIGRKPGGRWGERRRSR